MLSGDNIYLLKNKGKREETSKNIGFFRKSYDFWRFYSEKVITFLESYTVIVRHSYPQVRSFSALLKNAKPSLRNAIAFSVKRRAESATGDSESLIGDFFTIT